VTNEGCGKIGLDQKVPKRDPTHFGQVWTKMPLDRLDKKNIIKINNIKELKFEIKNKKGIKTNKKKR